MRTTSTGVSEQRAFRSASEDVETRTQRMYKQIVVGLTEHRIAPGSRLREEKLGTIFEVSRTQVRKVLLKLEHEGLVKRKPNRGVTVVAPNIAETRDIFEARRLIESWVVARLSTKCTKQDVQGLRRIVRGDQKAQEKNDRHSAVRLSGEFHRALAQAAGNRSIAKSMDELTMRTCLAILANQAPIQSTCRYDEHDRIIEAIERGDGKLATRLMVNHLDDIESCLQVPTIPAEKNSINALFEEITSPAPRKRALREKS